MHEIHNLQFLIFWSKCNTVQGRIGPQKVGPPLGHKRPARANTCTLFVTTPHLFFSYTFINLRIQYLISLEVRPLKLLLKSLIPIMDTFLHFLQFRSFSTLGDQISVV